MSNISVYGFENNKGEPDEFTTLNFEEAKEYARRYQLKIVEHVYEWTEQVPVEGHDYTTDREPPDISNISRELPTVGTRVRLGCLENFDAFLIEEPGCGTVINVDVQQGLVWVKLDKHWPELDEWDNEWGINIEFLGDDYREITDREERLAIAFWLDATLTTEEQPA